MGRRSSKPVQFDSTTIEAQINTQLNGGSEDCEDSDESEEGKGFFACYLLTSLSPRHKGHTYIGFTVNPRRRIRQHNGEMRSGAWRTKRGRPWEMILCIYGFPTNVSALQFEWAWQHPRESLAVRKAASDFKSLSGISNKIKIAYTMLSLPAWETLNVTVNFFSTKYMKFAAGCPKLPRHMKVVVHDMDELPCYDKGQIFEDSDEEDDMECNEDTLHKSSNSLETCVEENANWDKRATMNDVDWWRQDDEMSQSADLEFATEFQQSVVEPLNQKVTSESPKPKPDHTSPSNINEDNNYYSWQPSSPEGFSAMATPCNLKLLPERNVIDLLSPTSSSADFCSKKQKKTSGLTNFIDLTDSPLIIEL